MLRAGHYGGFPRTRLCPFQSPKLIYFFSCLRICAKEKLKNRNHGFRDHVGTPTSEKSSLHLLLIASQVGIGQCQAKDAVLIYGGMRTNPGIITAVTDSYYGNSRLNTTLCWFMKLLRPINYLQQQKQILRISLLGEETKASKHLSAQLEYK